MNKACVWEKGNTRPPYYVQTGSMYENPFGVPVNEIKEMEKTLPMEMVAQAIYGMYVESSGLVFSAGLIGQLFDGEAIRAEKWQSPDVVPPGRKGRAWSAMTRGDRVYVAGVDLARQNDYTVIMVFDVTMVPALPGKMVYYERLNRVSWDAIYAAIARVSYLWCCECLIDSTGMGGDVVLDELNGRFYCSECDVAVPFSLTGGETVCPRCESTGHPILVGGYNFAGRRKEQLITSLKSAMGFGDGAREHWGLLRMPHIEQVADELTFYRLDDKGLSTDTVMALGLCAVQMDFGEQSAEAGSVHDRGVAA